MSYDLSFIIPARNEYFESLDLLQHTVTNVLANTSEKSEVVVILDGYQPPQPLPESSRLTVIHHPKSIGQRAACNEGARVSTAKFICKLDAHCAVGPEFDTRMIEKCDYLTTLIPTQYNLHAFSWRCKSCNAEQYQGPKPERCLKCRKQWLKLVPVWKPRGWKLRDGEWSGNPKTTSWYFDSTLHFQYDGSMAQRFPPEQRLTPTMTCLGACWMLYRERYWELEGMDEKYGSWGNQGVELALKSWLSGGQMLVNHDTWFAHLFRTQPGFGFPYANPGGERARARSREVWFQNQWPKQVYPLSWLVEKFKPVRDWHTFDNPVLTQVAKAGVAFRVTHPLTDNASSISLVGVSERKQVASDAVGSSGLLGTGTVTAKQVDLVSRESQVEGATAAGIVAEMVNNESAAIASGRERSDQPRPNDSVKTNLGTVMPNSSVAKVVSVTNPVPASVVSELNTGKDTGDLVGGQMIDGEVFLGSHDATSNVVSGSESELRNERSSDLTILSLKPRKLCLYYTCNSHDETLELAARNNLRQATNGHEVGCVSLQRTDFGDWTIVVNREKSGGTMHYQILAGLERSTADYVFLCESDVFYHPSHFDFIPPRDDTFYYNTNVWRVRYEDGHAVRTDNLQQVSGICANRKLLLAHYRKRVELIEANGGKFDTKRMAYEPGTRGKFGDEKIATWESPFPNVDITGHGQTLTTPHFSVDSFRNKKYAEGWQETDDALPGWPKLAGRINEWLAELAHG